MTAVTPWTLRPARTGDAAGGLPVRLNVLQGSAARRLYERHGFTVTASDPVDVFMLRPATVPPAVTGPDGAGET